MPIAYKMLLSVNATLLKWRKKTWTVTDIEKMTLFRISTGILLGLSKVPLIFYRKSSRFNLTNLSLAVANQVCAPIGRIL